MSAQTDTPRPLLGRRELVALPDLGIPRLEARVDTGARTSALHVAWTRIDEGRVRFGAVVRRARDGREARIVEAEAPLSRTALVRSSDGRAQERPIIRTTIVIGGRARAAEVSLVPRERMRYRMLLGRTAIAPDYLVDAGAARLQGEPTGGAP